MSVEDIKDPVLGSVEDDDPDAPDEDEVETSESARRAARSAVTADDDDEDPDVEDEDEDEEDPPSPSPAVKGKAKPEDKGADTEQPAKGDDQPPTAKPAQPPEKTFTQADVDRIVQQRLARDKAAYEKQVLSATGKTLEQLKAETRERRILDLQTEKGLDEETARQVADQEARLRELEAKEKDLEREHEIAKATRTYQASRTTFLADTKLSPKVKALIQQHAEEIDTFADHGAEVPWEAAVTFVLGQKVLAGELFATVEKATEQRVLNDVSKRARTAPEKGGGGAPQPVQLSPAEREIARRMGVSPERYAKQKANLAKSKRAAR